MRLCRLMLLLLATSCSSVNSDRPPRVEQASAAIAAEMAEQQIPGVALVALRGDDLIVARGFGVEDAGRADPVTPETVFALGSIAKQFVAALIVQLTERGRLGLDDPVAGHLPQFTRLPPGLTIRHLLNHTSGMRDEFIQPELRGLFNLDTGFAQYAEAARHSPADFAPGERWSYANINYLMLGLIAERAGGAPLGRLAAERLFRPLGLSSIGYCPNQPGRTRGEARGHVVSDGVFAPHPPENFALFRASGGFCGSAIDVARWTRALATGKVVSPQSYGDMTWPARLNDGSAADYGLGIMLVAPDGVKRLGHGGYGGGFAAQIAYYPARQLTIAVLANRFIFAEHIERKVARRLLGVADPQPVVVPLSDRERARFAGRYDIGVHGWPVTFAERDGRLWFELPAPSMKLPLAYLGNGRFVSSEDADGYQVEFSPDASSMRLLGMGMMHWYGRRIPPAGEGDAPYRPTKFGWRFSRNAATPSR